jgi:hypothetical protein
MRLNHIIIATIALVCSATTGQVMAQETGPGGVGSSANMAFWLDANQLGLGNGDPVSTWTDMSGNGNDFTQGVGGNQPSFLSAGSINGMPSVDFDGSDFMESGAIPELDGDEVSFFIVFKSGIAMSNGDVRCFINNETSATNQAWKAFLYRASNSISSISRHAKNATLNNVIAQSQFNTSEIQDDMIASMFWSSGDVVSGKLNAIKNNTAGGANLNGWTHSKTTIGSQYGTIRFFDGEFTELFVFNEVVNTAQEIIIYNYLAGKYNITLDADAHYANIATHGVDVAGIGREDASNIHNSAQGTGLVAVTSAGITTDGAYLLWGHDDGGMTGSTTTNVPAAYAATGGTRLAQEWSVSEISEVGAVTLTVDLTGLEFGKDDQYELLVDTDGDGDFSNATVHSGTPAAGPVVSFSLAAGDLEDGYLFAIGNTQEKVISVVDGQNWNDATTWSSDFVPNNLNDVIIDNGHTVTVNDAQTTLDLNVNGTGTFVVDAGADMGVEGNVDSDGTFTVNSGSKITLNGAAAQSLDFVGTVAFDSLEVDNSNGATFNTGTFTFSGTFFPTDGNVDFGANGVTFLSSAAGTASVGPIGAGVSVTMTNVTSQRFIEGGSAGWSEVGFPFNNSFMFSDWDDELFMSGPHSSFADGCAMDGNGCFNSITYWDPATTTTFGVNRADSAVSAGRGFDIYLGDNLTVFSANTLSVTKELNFTRNPAVTLVDGWNFIANPVLAPINFNDVTFGGALTDDYFWVFDAEDGWQFYEPGGAPETFSANLAGGIISAYQGIWMFKNAGIDEDVTFNESAKSVTSADAFVKTANNNIDHGYFTLRIEDKARPTSFGRLYVDFSGERRNMPKLPMQRDHINVSANFGGKEYSLLSLDSDVECVKIPMAFEGVSDGIYGISVENIPADRDLYVVNLMTGERLQLTDKSGVEVYITEANRSGFQLVSISKAGECDVEEGFDLNFSYSAVNGIVVSDFSNADDATFTFNVYDVTGKMVSSSVGTVNAASQFMIPAQLSFGSYIVEVRNGGEIVGTGKVAVLDF